MSVARAAQACGRAGRAGASTLGGAASAHRCAPLRGARAGTHRRCCWMPGWQPQALTRGAARWSARRAGCCPTHGAHGGSADRCSRWAEAGAQCARAGGRAGARTHTCTPGAREQGVRAADRTEIARHGLWSASIPQLLQAPPAVHRHCTRSLICKKGWLPASCMPLQRAQDRVRSVHSIAIAQLTASARFRTLYLSDLRGCNRRWVP